MTPSSGTSAAWEPKMTFWPFTSLGTHSSMERGMRTPWPFSPCRGNPWPSQWITLVRLGFRGDPLLCLLCCSSSDYHAARASLSHSWRAFLSILFMISTGGIDCSNGPVLLHAFHLSFSGLSEKQRYNSKRIRHDFEEKMWAFSHSAFLSSKCLFRLFKIAIPH